MNHLKNQGKKIMIAGVRGMVGSAIYRAFLNKNSSYSTESTSYLIPSRKDLDLTIYNQVDDWFKENKPNTVIIAAAVVGGIYANKTYPTQFILENLKIQTNLIEISRKYGVEKLLFLGSSCIYPKYAPQPITEDALLSGALEPTNEFYAIAKIAGIKLCEALNIQYGFKSISLMPTNLYGPGDNYHSMNSHVMPALIKKITDAKYNNIKSITCWGSGKPLREFLYVDDLAEACLFALDNWDPTRDDSPRDSQGNPLFILNVGSKFEISIKDLVQKIVEIVDYDGNILWDNSKPDGTPRKKLDTSKMSNLGWNAKTDLNTGIRLTLDAYKNELKNKNIRV